MWHMFLLLHALVLQIVSVLKLRPWVCPLLLKTIVYSFVSFGSGVHELCIQYTIGSVNWYTKKFFPRQHKKKSNSPLQKLRKTGSSEGLWDRLGRRKEIAPLNKCISWKSAVQEILLQVKTI